MQTVFRVQNAQGQGPYTKANLALPSHHLLDDPERWPPPRVDFEVFAGVTRYSEECHIVDELVAPYKFGFLTREDAVNWFSNEDLVHMSKVGYDLVAIPASEVHVSISKKQVMFR